MTRELQRAIQAMAVECDDTYAMANSIEDMLEEIFDDHEAQLNAKDKEIERLKADIIKASYADGKLRKLAQVVDKPLDQALKLLDSNFTK